MLKKLIALFVKVLHFRPNTVMKSFGYLSVLFEDGFVGKLAFSAAKRLIHRSKRLVCQVIW